MSIIKKYLCVCITLLTSQLFAEESTANGESSLKKGTTEILIETKQVEEKPSPEEKNAFVLQVPEKEGKMIEEIIVTMGTNNVLALGFKKGHLKSLGKKLKGVGPLQFLGYIFTNPKLKKQMQVIYKSTVKWKGFINGVIPGLKRDSTSDNFYKNLLGFSTLLKLDYESLREKAEKQQWDGFVIYIMNNTNV